MPRHGTANQRLKTVNHVYAVTLQYIGDYGARAAVGMPEFFFPPAEAPDSNGIHNFCFRERIVRISCDDLYFVPSGDQKSGEVVHASAGAPDSIREKNISEHQDAHFGRSLKYRG